MQQLKIEATKFTVVGAINFVLTFIIFTFSLKVLHIDYLVSLGLAWLAGVLLSYLLNFLWVFKPAHRLQFNSRFIKFLLASLTSLIINMVTLKYLVEHSQFDPFLIQVSLMPLIIIFNFITAKFWSLRPGDGNLSNIIPSLPLNSQCRNIISLSILCLICTALAGWRFFPWMSNVFYGDDLWYLLAFQKGECATKAAEILVDDCAQKFRPLASGFILLLFNLFASNLSYYYLAINTLLLGISCTLAFTISQKLGSISWKIGLLIAFAIAASRFATYSTTQIIGPVEGLALPLFLGMLYCVIKASEHHKNPWYWCWLSIGLAFLTILTHERYIVVAFWLMTAFFLLPGIRKQSLIRLCTLNLACLALPVIYISYKLVVLNTAFLVGTGGHHLELNSKTMFVHALQAICSILGFNLGPAYLVGIKLSELPWFPAWLFAAALAIAWLVSIVTGSWFTSKQSNRSILAWPFLLLTLGVILLAPAILTIHLEQRWIFTPFILIIYLLPVALTRSYHPKLVAFASGLLVIICVASVALDTLIMQHYDRLYFVNSARFAQQVKEEIIDKRVEKIGSSIFFSSEVQCSWTLMKGGFFKIYEGAPRDIKCFSSVEESFNAKLPDNVHFYKVSGNQLKDVTTSWQLAKLATQDQSFDFLAAFNEGHINSSQPVSTPNGLGVFPMQLQDDLGGRNSLVVVTGFSYQFNQIPISSNDELAFGISMVYPSQEPARGVVKILVEGIDEPIVALVRDLPPPLPNTDLHFEAIKIPLSKYTGKRVAFIFATETPGHNPSGHWVAFSNPRIAKNSTAIELTR